MTTKLSDMQIDEISLVDDPANGEARVLIVKAKNPPKMDDEDEDDEEMMDDESAKTPKKKGYGSEYMKKFREALEDAELDDEQKDAVAKAAEALAEAISGTTTASAAKEKTMDLEALSKALGEAEAKLVALEKRSDEAEAALAEAQDVIKQKDAELAEVKKSAGTNDEEEILKSLPESVRKRLEESERQAKEASDAIAKMKAETEEKDAIAKAKALGVGDAEKVGPMLMRVAKGTTTDEDAKFLESLLKGVGEIAGKSALFKSLGSASAEEGNPEQQMQAKADEIKKANPKLSKEQAYAEAVQQNPHLYNDYVAKRRG